MENQNFTIGLKENNSDHTTQHDNKQTTNLGLTVGSGVKPDSIRHTIFRGMIHTGYTGMYYTCNYVMTKYQHGT